MSVPFCVLLIWCVVIGLHIQSVRFTFATCSFGFLYAEIITDVSSQSTVLLRFDLHSVWRVTINPMIASELQVNWLLANKLIVFSHKVRKRINTVMNVNVISQNRVKMSQFSHFI